MTAKAGARESASDQGGIVLKKVMEAIRAVERAFIAIVMLAMSLLYFLNVVAREASPRLATDLAWIEEATLFALAWLVFVGLGLALEQRRHITMSALRDRLPMGVQRWLQVLINLTGLAFSAFLAKISVDLTVFILHSGQISPTLGVTMALLYGSVPVGFALLSLRYLLELLHLQDRTTITPAAEP